IDLAHSSVFENPFPAPSGRRRRLEKFVGRRRGGSIDVPFCAPRLYSLSQQQRRAPNRPAQYIESSSALLAQRRTHWFNVGGSFVVPSLSLFLLGRSSHERSPSWRARLSLTRS
uniref:Uncharacterized protein n=1 Tax=Plectus sambesii TaxID=2011161 RepID=A0A914XGR5_9BILA